MLPRMIGTALRQNPWKTQKINIGKLIVENSTRNCLIKLKEAGRLTSSQVPKSAAKEINQIKDQGFIDWERSGRGGIYTINDPEAIKTLLENTGYHGPTENLSSKARAVAFHKDAHKGRDDTLLLMLSATNGVKWQNNGVSVDIFRIVRQCGIASLLIRPEDNWQTDDPIALVENKDLLVYADRYFKQIQFTGSILYYRGWVSKRTIAWLKKQRNIPITIFPDYDLVGLKNYLILKKELPDINIYIPGDLPNLLTRYGKSEKLNSSTDRKIIEQTRDADALYIYSQILKYGVCLDQESLMLTS